jgi:REP element-mobilizing transposase RayT
MPYDISYEDPEKQFFSTTRTVNSRLWFVNNPVLHQRILAFLARYQERFNVILYALVIMGNHYHLLAEFPEENKSDFYRCFNSIVARLTKRYVEEFEGGPLWARRARSQEVGKTREDILNRFFYEVLNPVKSGLASKISDYDGYNSFHHSITGRTQTFEIFNREDYNNRKRYNKHLTPADCVSKHTLKFSRLPGFEDMPQDEYIKMMKAELERRRGELIKERQAEGLGFVPKEVLRAQKPGSKPKTTKTSERTSKRPLILTGSREVKQAFNDWYWPMRAAYKEASRRFRLGELTVEFPPGTYRPPSRAG